MSIVAAREYIIRAAAKGRSITKAAHYSAGPDALAAIDAVIAEGILTPEYELTHYGRYIAGLPILRGMDNCTPDVQHDN